MRTLLETIFLLNFQMLKLIMSTILSIHFIDPKTNAEIESIPVRPYYGNASGITEVLNAALEEVGKKLQAEVTIESKKKKN